MFRTTIVTCGIIAVSCGTLGAAQSTATDQGKMDDKNKTVMVTGCVTDAMGHYTLTNAMISDDALPTTSQTPPSSVGTTGSTGDSYGLTGGELKAHVGHKVEVTGTMDATMKTGSLETGKTVEKDRQTTGSPAATKGMLTVTSVKMISSSCP